LNDLLFSDVLSRYVLFNWSRDKVFNPLACAFFFFLDFDRCYESYMLLSINLLTYIFIITGLLTTVIEQFSLCIPASLLFLDQYLCERAHRFILLHIVILPLLVVFAAPCPVDILRAISLKRRLCATSRPILFALQVAQSRTQRALLPHARRNARRVLGC
jgi:hypothetical protein